MTLLYKPHTVHTIAEVNALALADRQQNGAYVIAEGTLCTWNLPYATRNERPGHWFHEDGLLSDGDEASPDSAVRHAASLVIAAFSAGTDGLGVGGRQCTSWF